MATEKEKEAIRRRLRLKKNRLKMMEMEGGKKEDQHSYLESGAVGALDSIGFGYEDAAISKIGSLFSDQSEEDISQDYRDYKKS